MKLHEKFRKVEEELNELFVEREEMVHGLALAMLSENNMLLLGPPGTAKSMIVRGWQEHISAGKDGAKYFEYLLTKFSTPEEIFGPISLRAIEEDKYVRITTGKLPETHLGFMDEIFKCNSGLLNAMLPVLNERIFHNDGKAHKIPLLTVIGASNEIPDSDDGLDALFDRFLIKFMVKPVQEETGFIRMLMTDYENKPKTNVTLKEIKEAQVAIAKVELNEGMADLMTKIRRNLKHEGIFPSDRTFKTSIRILKAEAFLEGRDHIVEDDFDVLRNVLWADPTHERTVWTTILDIISPEKGQIVSLYEKALEVSNKTLSEKNQKKKIELGIDTAAKLKEIKTKISKLIKQMDKKKKNTTDVKAYESKLNALLGRVFQESCGLSPDSMG